MKNKFLSIGISIASALCISTAITSCGSGFGSPSEEDRAKEVANQIDSAINTGDYYLALELIDTLNQKFPKQLEVRKTTLLSRAKAMEGLVRDSIPYYDELIVRTQLEIDSLNNFFTTVREKGLPDYKVDRDAAGINVVNGNVVQPRLGDSADPWVLIVSVQGHKGLQSISADKNGENVYIDITDPGRILKGSSTEMISLNSYEGDKIAGLIGPSPEENTVINIAGKNSGARITVSPKIGKTIWRTSRLAQVIEENRKAKVQRELLERKLIVAQNQIANFDNPTK